MKTHLIVMQKPIDEASRRAWPHSRDPSRTETFRLILQEMKTFLVKGGRKGGIEHLDFTTVEKLH